MSWLVSRGFMVIAECALVFEVVNNNSKVVTVTNIVVQCFLFSSHLIIFYSLGYEYETFEIEANWTIAMLIL